MPLQIVGDFFGEGGGGVYLAGEQDGDERYHSRESDDLQ